jgi:putative tRNA adenosine deaminase-associated protein
VFVSDAAGVAASRYASVLDIVAEDGDDDAAVTAGTCSGDFDVLADLGTSAETLQEMCEDELLPMDALAAVAEGAGFAEVLDSLR